MHQDRVNLSNILINVAKKANHVYSKKPPEISICSTFIVKWRLLENHAF